SSRRRHTRLVSDWSSDVCSSDLRSTTPPPYGPHRSHRGHAVFPGCRRNSTPATSSSPASPSGGTATFTVQSPARLSPLLVNDTVTPDSATLAPARSPPNTSAHRRAVT